MNNLTWFSGIDNYRKHCFTKSDHENIYHLELLDTTIVNQSISDLFADFVSARSSKKVAVLYSGGLDSECVIRALMIKRIPVVAYTLKLMINDVIVNTHDMYYSEKFCRIHDIKQNIITLDVKKFFEHEYYLYLEPYLITQFHVSTHFWLIKQIDDFVIIGGDYNWPWVDQKILSPQRLNYACYDRYLNDIKHQGIGNMLSHSLSSNLQFIKAHIKTYEQGYRTQWNMIPLFKTKILENLELGKFEPRLRSYGWENLDDLVFDYKKLNQTLEQNFKPTKNRITWNYAITDILGGFPASNTYFN